MTNTLLDQYFITTDVQTKKYIATLKKKKESNDPNSLPNHTTRKEETFIPQERIIVASIIGQSLGCN